MNKKIAVFILMLVAAVFITIPLLSIIKSVKIRKAGVTTESTVLKSVRTSSKGSGLKNVTVTFTNHEGSQVIATARKRYFVSDGDKVKIWYDPANPQNIDFGDTIGYNMRGVIAGGILFIFGLYYFIKYSFSDKSKKRLISSGQKIAAEFVSVDRDERFRAGDNNPWIIKCKWIDNRDNHEYFFVSKTYTIDPAPYLNGRYHIDVFIDPADPGKYFMDTSFMPKGNNTIG